ncbi:hypothetical protein [Haloferula sp. BvORR071]|uniref:hypothetical protein n=1 Tax=Haloferula sp. BvORR071 TaxID=1396141 RepID=UPI0005505945|nr:hypothetical protein [Haloferula sp. BvORR071]
MKLGILPFLLGSFALVTLGWQDVFMALKHREVVEVSLSDYIKNRPDAKWLKITGARLDILHAIYFSPRFLKMDAQDVYVPVVVPGNDPSKETIHIVLHSSSPELLKLINEAKGFGDDGKVETKQKGMDLVMQSLEASLLTRDIGGLVQYGLSSNDKRDFEIRKDNPNIAKDFVVLEDGGKPSLLKGLLIMAPGLLLGAGVVQHMRKGKQPQPLPQMPPRPKPIVRAP